ncbi:MAG: UDP-N-acetylglucosamine-peptide N-acetylglucosaminyltransferase, partial [Deltaproteobacteria bacterium]|nr:UDP-N-acetylglucosamine-peptide N-acetylglucosaminyltransferase [Deltaproteobacteria bacterium]
LTAMGLPELIAHSLKEYETLAVELATFPDYLKNIKEKLIRNRLSEPLFDTPRFVKNLEKAFKEMRKLFLAGQGPGQIEIVES